MNAQIKPMSFKITEENSFTPEKISVKNENMEIEKDEIFIEKGKSLYKFSIFLLLSTSLIIFGLIAESIIFAKELLEISSIFGYIYLSMLSGIIYFIFTFSYREISSYLDIAKVEKIQEMAKKLERTPTKNSVEFANMLIQKYQNSTNIKVLDAITKFQKDVSGLEYAQILPRVSENILSPIDLEVEKIVFKYAKENALATAISPIPLFDALFIIWRNIRMVNQISNIYGFRTGIIGNFKLLKRVAEQLIFIGVAELTADSISILTGQTIASKLSSSIAQGVGHSILTVRIGLATIQVSRPIHKKSDTSMILRFLKSFNPFKKSS